MKNIIMKILGFIVLSVWIIFLSLTANNFYAPSVWDQDEAIESCLSKHKLEDRDKFNRFLFQKTGSGMTILMTGKGPYFRSSVCIYRDNKIVMFLP